ncbi:MAG: outer membrane protein assembly factor BamD [Acidobacteria bacterium]|nr:outer membrane protein assembly factor BamD [Acidobacteriota bacterium]
MKFPTPIVVFLIAVQGALYGQKKEVMALQRDVADLQEQVRTLQRTLDEKTTALQVLVQQTLESSNRANTSATVIERAINERLGEQAKNLNAPVANLSAKVEQMSTDFQAVREGIADLTARMGKMQQQIVDLANTVKVMQSPPPPPGGTTSTGPPAGLSSKQLYDNAIRDRNAGNLDLAMQGFNEYLKYFGDTELAPNAQFYIAQIYYDRNDFDNALQSFDVVLEKYPENNKTPDAHYMKGMTLLKMTRRTDAAKEFLTVIQKFPQSEVAAKARAQRRALGLSVPPSRAKTRRE